MKLEEKYNRYKETYFKYFIHKGKAEERCSNIPLESIDLVNLKGYVGDGTINLAHHIQYMYTGYLLGEFTNEDVNECINTYKRLAEYLYAYMKSLYPRTYFIHEPGFFLRDDIESSKSSLYNLNSIHGSYSGCIEHIDEDPCHSPFVSQDQVWNIIPILDYLKNKFSSARVVGRSMLEYIVRNNHKIYNPYYSAIYHEWTYLPTFNETKVKPWERVNDRNKNLKYSIKVKRGANNWYFSYGFKKAFNSFGGNSRTFWSSLWYKPFIFLADRIYHPYICKWFNLKVKNTSYYSLGLCGAWYGPNYDKRLVKKFNKSLDGKDLFMPELVFLSSRISDIDMDKLKIWLENYEDIPENSDSFKNPVIFLILYNWYKLNVK